MASTRSSVRRDPAGWCWAARPTREPTEELEWNATLVEGDLEDAIPKLKHEVDGDLFMHGSGEFAYALAETGLVDEYEIYLNPLVWGQGNVHVLARWSRLLLAACHGSSDHDHRRNNGAGEGLLHERARKRPGQGARLLDERPWPGEAG